MKHVKQTQACVRVATVWGALALAACGGGGGGGGGGGALPVISAAPSEAASAPAESTTPAPPAPSPAATPAPAEPLAPAAPPALTDADILALAAGTNLTGTSYPWNNRFPGVVKRWRLPIPVKTNGEARAAPALDAIEAALGFTVFDRVSIASADDSAITRGLVFRQGTSYFPAGSNPQSFCANVSDAPLSGGWSASMYPPGELTGRIYINLDNPQCTADAELVIHEIGHAMGLATHFTGFGGDDDDGAIGPEFWSVLATLYANPIGTGAASVVVRRVAQ